MADISELNEPISFEETKRALMNLKNGKAVGLDNLPNEILKNDRLTNILNELFNVCFCYGIVPDNWCLSIICPLLKKGKDQYDPLNYRSISLMSTVAKTFSQILNNRLMKYLENNKVLSEEQNGFRYLRSCLDHIFSLCTILRNRKLQNLDTYLCFVDFSKAFDSVNHIILWNKLLTAGVHGNMYKTIKCLYSKLKSSVRITPVTFTDWFDIESGVRQGDNLAPTLFALFIDDLVPLINSLDKGVSVGDDMISCLLYADDLVLISDTSDGLQAQMNTLNEWTKSQMMSINIEKTKVMHTRKPSTDISQYVFKLGNRVVEYVSKYRYLGLTISDTIDFNVTVNELVAAASRSLGSLTSKFLYMGNMDYNTYAKIYDNTVIPVMDYGSGVWGTKRYDTIERLQYRAVRTFLGVGKTAPIPALLADIGWYPIHIHNQCNVIRLFCRVVNMHDYRLSRKVFMWDRELSRRYRNTWFNSVKDILERCELFDITDIDSNIPTKHVLDIVKTKLSDDFKEKWLTEISTMPKLRSYKLFKTDFCAEPYVKGSLTRVQRSALARLRCGTFPLEIERGRYRNVPCAQRICKMCDSGAVEDEKHFMLSCARYTDLRNKLLSDISTDPAYPIVFQEHSLDVAFKELITSNPKLIANFILDCDTVRKQFL